MTLALAVMIGTGTSVSANACGTIVRVTFVEASPDRFLIEHLKGHVGDVKSVSIDLSSSVGKAYVDTTYGPATLNADASVEVDSVAGFATGAQTGSISFRAFRSGHAFRYLVDLDDNAAGGDFNMDVLTANELEGGTVIVRIADPAGTVRDWEGVFGSDGIARVGNQACA